MLRRTLSNGTNQRSSWLRRLWIVYDHSITTRPLLTKTTSAAIIFFSSDTVTQYLSSTDNNDDPLLFQWDGIRALSGAFFGVAGTCFLHFWWGVLEGVVEARVPVKTNRALNTLLKVAIDQSLAAPFYIYSYYIVTRFLQNISSSRTNGPRASFAEAQQKANAIILPTMLVHWKVWPLVHSLNFYFVPLNHRVLVQNVVLIGWSGCKFTCFCSNPHTIHQSLFLYTHHQYTKFANSALNSP